MDPIELEIEANKEKTGALAEELKNLNQDTHEKETIKKAKSKINEKGLTKITGFLIRIVNPIHSSNLRSKS